MSGIHGMANAFVAHVESQSQSQKTNEDKNYYAPLQCHFPDPAIYVHTSCSSATASYSGFITHQTPSLAALEYISTPHRTKPTISTTPNPIPESAQPYTFSPNRDLLRPSQANTRSFSRSPAPTQTRRRIPPIPSAPHAYTPQRIRPPSSQKNVIFTPKQTSKQTRSCRKSHVRAACMHAAHSKHGRT
jgi:hypothetical protein